MRISAYFRETPQLVVGGTFKIATNLFFQVFTVHALVNNNFVPIIYALFQYKNGVWYARYFKNCWS